MVTLSNLSQLYDGTPRVVTGASVFPSGLAVAVSYDGSATPPTLPGSYGVVGTIVDANYVGTAAGTLVVSTRYVSRHAPTLNGRVQDSLQVLLPETVTLNGSALIKGDLIVPGLPSVVVNADASFVGTIDGTGSATPDSHAVVLNGRSFLNHVVRRVDAAALPVVDVPPPPTGTRDVVISRPGDAIGDPATLRNLTLNRGAGDVALPAGTYGTLIANRDTRLVLGVEGATQPAVYNLQGLVVNAQGKLVVVGPVVINLAGDALINGGAGHEATIDWLRLNLASGGLTLNGAGLLAGHVLAPAGTVQVNAWLFGSVAADRLVVNATGRLSPKP